MHEVRRDGGDRVRSRRWFRLHLILTGLIALSVLAACGSDDNATVEDRRFATDPMEPTSTAAATETPATQLETAISASTATSTIVVSPTPAIASTVTTVYAIAEDAVIAVDTASNATRVLDRSNDERSVARISSSLDGESVAILYSVANGDDTRYDLSIRNKNGDETAHWTDIESALDRMNEPGKGRLLLDWSNSAGKIAVAFPDGGAIVVTQGEDPHVLLRRSQAPTPTSLQWSPKGDAIAFVSKNANGDGSYLSIASAQALPVDPVKINGTGGDRPILSLAWMQDSSAILAIQGSTSRDDQVGGDLIRVDRRTLKPTLVTGASLFGPSAQIVAASPSPDGQTIAYVSVEPKDNGGWLATVWVVDNGVPVQQRVALDEDPPVADIGWTAAGLAVTLLEPDRVSVVTVDEGGAIVGEAEATEIASPSAPPDAFPSPELSASAPTQESTPASPQP